MLFHHKFFSYKECSNSYAILVKVPCLGIRVIRYFLVGKQNILHDVLNAPNLHNPLLSVQCFRQLNGCSFIADNSGCFLTFLKFYHPVDCIIRGFNSLENIPAPFDSQLVGSIFAISDNTHFQSTH
jgi:hypothetical protein